MVAHEARQSPIVRARVHTPRSLIGASALLPRAYALMHRPPTKDTAQASAAQLRRFFPLLSRRSRTRTEIWIGVP